MNEQDNIFRPEKTDHRVELLVELYKNAGVPLDSLPYTEAFEALFQEFQNRFDLGDTISARHDVLHDLLALRKSGRLPRLSGQVKKSTTDPLF